MMFFLYIIYSPKKDRFYVGQTSNLENRLQQHNTGINKSTAGTNDWSLVYSETFENRQLAQQREREIKKKKSRKYI